MTAASTVTKAYVASPSASAAAARRRHSLFEHLAYVFWNASTSSQTSLWNRGGTYDRFASKAPLHTRLQIAVNPAKLIPSHAGVATPVCDAPFPAFDEAGRGGERVLHVPKA